MINLKVLRQEEVFHGCQACGEFLRRYDDLLQRVRFFVDKIIKKL